MSTERPSFALTERGTALLVAAISIWALLLIPVRIVGLGWMPPDDARRHAAKVVSDRDWSEILVLRPEATVDPHPGWHALLELAERAGIGSTTGLLKLSVILGAAIVLLAPVPLLRRPESWLLALALAGIFEPRIAARFLLGRPLLVTIAALLVLALLADRLGAERAPRGSLVGVAALVAFSAWIHGNWYLWLLPIAAFALAGELRAAARLAGCAALGIAAGALATGSPLAFLFQTAAHPFWALRGAETATTVTEFHPTEGAPLLLLAVGLLALARRQLGLPGAGRASRPLFLLAAIGWGLGLWIYRFWTDWGLPALLVGVTLELQAALEAPRAPSGRRRLLVAGLAAAVVVLVWTSDARARWTKFPANRVAALERPELASWLPEPGGIVYSNEMHVFYDLFFAHPNAPWRFQLGFEPGLQPPADLAIYRRIRREAASDASLGPWAERMTAADRMILVRRSARAPGLPGLEWASPRADLWVGRRPRPGRPTAPVRTDPEPPASGAIEPSGDDSAP